MDALATDTETPCDDSLDDAVRRGCEGVVPLRANLEPWMKTLCCSSNVHDWINEHGSPLNVLRTDPLTRNLENLNRVAGLHDLDFRVYFARKANKCLSFVDAANDAGAGIDTASLVEMTQVIERGVDSSRLICTAAIKDDTLLRHCVANGVTVAVDNLDELRAIKRIVADSSSSCSIALRISGFEHDGEKLYSRFGFDVDDVLNVIQKNLTDDVSGSLTIDGIHFHLDGYSAEQRVSAISQSLLIIDAVKSLGHDLKFLDIGGGFPMSYLESESQWMRFLDQHRLSLLGQRESVTFQNHGLGLLAEDGQIYGRLNCYPYYQRLVQADWLGQILDSSSEDGTIAESIRRRDLQLRCEPGRSLLDGCGVTVARVEFCKLHHNGDWLVGLSMNTTQCRTTSEDFLVDPIIMHSSQDSRSTGADGEMEGYLVGAYCMESELLLKRKLRFPRGIEIGDLVVFPNTAGYLMHFLESRSHQFPLARNVVIGSDGAAALDPIDHA